MKRLFFALWPDDATREQLISLRQKISDPNLRKIKPHNLHVTLVFLGNVADDIAQAVEDDAAQIQASCFSFNLESLEFWPRPRVLCVTAGKQPSALHDLVDQLTDMVSQYPVHLEQRPYRAHVTLARKAKHDVAIDVGSIPWQAKDFVLVQSRSTEQGVHYEVIARWPLLAQTD